MNAIVNLCSVKPKNMPNPFDQKPDHDPMQIDSNQQVKGYPNFEEEKKMEHRVSVAAMDHGLSAKEQQMAQQYYERLAMEEELKKCKFCNKKITDEEEKNGGKTMLQSSECFHQVHIDCLKEVAIKKRSCDENVDCPDCHQRVQVWELNEYLTAEDQQEINKGQTQNIVK